MAPIVTDENDQDTVVLLESSKICEMSVTPVTAEEEYRKNLKLKKSDIDTLKAWTKSQPHFPKNISEEQIISFHHSCYYNLEDTKTCMNVYYTLRIDAPEYFVNRDVTSAELQGSLQTLEYGVIPKRDSNGYQIIFHRLKLFDASKYHFVEGVKLLAMAIDACLYVDGIAPGYVFLFDMRGVKLTHLTRLSIGGLRKFFLYVQEGLPVRLKAIHVLNTRPIVDKIMLLIKPFMKKELINMIHFHGSDDMEEVYKALPKSCLPSDFGGDLSSCEKIYENYIEWMKKLKPHFDEDEKNYVRKKGSKENQINDDINLRSLDID